MSDIAISVEHLGKQYRIGKRERYRALRDVITDGVAAPFRRLASLGRHATNGHPNGAEAPDTFWALKDVSFEVKRGEVLGIIGRNGAGKSTLLKILSRITEPTEGRVRVFGRVGSLLEVGTGFHPELTGRENIFMNGAILGMKRADIIRQFDEIVAFAEVEQFIDTPVKHYSSGMYVRLAFAVAAHMEPEILVVDEVLAVGDVQFQKKCLGKMGDAARQGRTILFVSHNMAAIATLCSIGIYLTSGTVLKIGAIHDVVSDYLRTSVPEGNRSRILDRGDRPFGVGQRLEIESVSLLHDTQPVYEGEPLMVQLEAIAHSDLENVFFGLGVDSLTGSRLLTVESNMHSIPSMAQGNRISVRIEIPESGLPPGRFVLAVGANAGLQTGLDFVPTALVLDISSNANEPLSLLERPMMGLRPRATWELCLKGS